MPRLKKISLYFTILIAVFVTNCDGYNRLLKSSNYELKLEKAQTYYAKGNYVKASALFEELIPVYKGTDKAEEIYYYYSYCNFYQGDYSLAQFHFKSYYRNFPTGKHAEECLFLNAYCYYLNSPAYHLDQTDTKNAMTEMQNFIDQFPESARIDSCNKITNILRSKLEKKEYDIIKQYYFIADYKAAIASGNNYMKEFPESTKIDEVLYVICDSYYLLAINSLEIKKAERLDFCIETYLKLLNLYPNSSFLQKAETIYTNCLKIKNNNKKS